jgi:hypothetical protein
MQARLILGIRIVFSTCFRSSTFSGALPPVLLRTGPTAPSKERCYARAFGPRGFRGAFGPSVSPPGPLGLASIFYLI